MKVLLLTDEFMPGGVPKHVVDLAHGLRQRGLVVDVAATDGSFRDRLSNEVRFVCLPLMKRESYSKNLPGLPRSLMMLVRLVQNGAYDVVHSHKRYSDMIARVLAGIMNIRHVSTCHNTFDQGALGASFGEITIAVSEAIRTMLIGQFHKDPMTIERIYNEITPFEPLSKEQCSMWRDTYRVKMGDRVIVSIGHFTKSKDQMTFLTALKILYDRGKLVSVTCFLVGHGSEEKRLRAYVEQTGLSENVRFCPGTTNVEPLLNIANFCVLSSVQDGGVPYVLLEAASLKRPHIATKVGGIPEFIENDHTGILVPPRDPQALAVRISEMLDTPNLVNVLGQNAWRKLMEQHVRGEFVAKTIQVYHRAMQLRG